MVKDKPMGDCATDRRIFFLINRSRHVLLKWADNYLMETLSITTSQLVALFILGNDDGCLLKDLSRGLGLNNSAITGLVSRMEKGGLIEKRSCELDGRASRVYITAKGKEVAEMGLPLVNQFNEVVEEGFSDDEMDVVYRFLNSIMAKVANSKAYEKTMGSSQD